ncbi:RNA polymerase sigma factor [Chitinophaga sp. Cy-1792]|uniref:RNA polymerase sigma factor n=1 Tax=Chitinophaga sp. Cy-1792 TaxID=2608339 RepID=UPI00141E6282|nr:sigma-70 family RNA polymerase sigma factor [Chitinophaga sp. Cy-1792]NIG56463.1 sigma-70 family RNA polymerase sigma factor [Chitinophaga sp. Cy-1792]
MAKPKNRFNLVSNSYLVQLLDLGKENAFTEIYDVCYKRLYKEAYYVTRDKELADDVVQNVFIAIWNRRESLPRPLNLKSYLVVCCRHEAYNQLQKARKIDEYKQVYDNTRPAIIEERLIENKEIYTQILKAMQKLPPKPRKIFEMAYLQHCTYQEIVEERGISLQTAKNEVCSSVKALRQILKGHYIQ